MCKTIQLIGISIQIIIINIMIIMPDYWLRGTGFLQLTSTVISTVVDHPLGSFSLHHTMAAGDRFAPAAQRGY